MVSSQELGGYAAIAGGAYVTAAEASALAGHSSFALHNALEPVGHAVSKGFEGITSLLSDEKVVTGLAVLFIALLAIMFGAKAVSGGGGGHGGH